jgi:murein DD-endopeptidase MepM/ murein hydrolase activator NlpD
VPRFLSPPLATLRVTSPFGPRAAPVGGASTDHKGVDFRAAVGTPVLAVDGATATRMRSTSGGGHELRLALDGGGVVDLLHLDSVAVYEGQHVEAGDVVAYSGDSGNVSGPHLHFGLIVGGEYVDPSPFLAAWLGGGGPLVALALLAVAGWAIA